MALDFDKFPSMEEGYLLVPHPPKEMEKYEALCNRCCSAIYMASHIGCESTRFIVSKEVHAAAYIRSALSEFVGMEDIAKTFPNDSKDNSLLIERSDNPLLHLMKLLRHYNVHVGSALCAEIKVPVIALGEGYDISASIINNLCPRSIKELRSGKYYELGEIEKMVVCFEREQIKLGVGNLLMKGILLYASMLCRSLTRTTV